MTCTAVPHLNWVDTALQMCSYCPAYGPSMPSPVISQHLDTYTLFLTSSLCSYLVTGVVDVVVETLLCVIFNPRHALQKFLIRKQKKIMLACMMDGAMLPGIYTCDFFEGHLYESLTNKTISHYNSIFVVCCFLQVKGEKHWFLFQVWQMCVVSTSVELPCGKIGYLVDVCGQIRSK